VRIPNDPLTREKFYNDLVRKCLVSREERKGDYETLRSYYLFGASGEEDPAPFNKIFPHIDQLVSFLYAAETTRFSIVLGAGVNVSEHKKSPKLVQRLNDEWYSSNADLVFGEAISWAMCYNSTFVKLIWKSGKVHPYMVEPSMMGVLREDVPYLDDQEAFVNTYYITKSDLWSRLYNHPNRDSILNRITASIKAREDIPEGVSRIVISQVNPTIYGNTNLNLSGYNRYKPRVDEPTVEMRELWLWNDEIDDYQCVTIADPGVVIYDRPGEQMFMKGEHPFIQVCPSPKYDYFWGISEVQRLIGLQDMRNRRMNEILDLLGRQVKPPTALIGFTGIMDEKNFALNRDGGLIATDMPNAKVEQFAPALPPDLFREIGEIDAMFAEVSGIVSVLQGRGEAGVRSSGHASQLAKLGSSRAKQRALKIEDSLEKMATLYMKMLQAYSAEQLVDEEGNKFIPEQFTHDYYVKVDAHSNSPIFVDESRALAFNLLKVKAINRERLIDLLDPPMKQLIKEDLKKIEQGEAMAAMAQQAQEQRKEQLKAVK
jgi:hypothetical protein